MPKIEICVDNLESVITANSFHLDRIELCSALSVGGISPNYGLLKQAVEISKIPLAVMVRVRAGDFLFSPPEITAMENEIALLKDLGIKHIVIGALTPTADIDLKATARFIAAAQGMEITFHRAFDLCRNPLVAMEQLIDLGCQRILTSGQAATAFEGMALLQKLVEQAENRIQIMAGAGVSAQNVKAILQQTGVPEIHFSARSCRLSEMDSERQVAMGANVEQDRYIERLDSAKLDGILRAIAGDFAL